MTFEEVNKLYVAIRLSTYTCSVCHDIIWPIFSEGENGEIMMSQEAHPFTNGHIIIARLKVCTECAAKLKRNYRKRDNK